MYVDGFRVFRDVLKRIGRFEVLHGMPDFGRVLYETLL